MEPNHDPNVVKALNALKTQFRLDPRQELDCCGLGAIAEHLIGDDWLAGSSESLLIRRANVANDGGSKRRARILASGVVLGRLGAFHGRWLGRTWAGL